MKSPTFKFRIMKKYRKVYYVIFLIVSIILAIYLAVVYFNDVRRPPFYLIIEAILIGEIAVCHFKLKGDK